MQTEVKIIDITYQHLTDSVLNKAVATINQLLKEGWQLHNNWINCRVSDDYISFRQMFVKYSSNEHRKMLEYKLIHISKRDDYKGQTLDHLQDKINIDLTKGWQLYGALQVNEPYGCHSYAVLQALVRYEEKSPLKDLLGIDM